MSAAKKAYGRLAAADGTNDDNERGQSESAGNANSATMTANRQSRCAAHRLIGELLGVDVYKPSPLQLDFNGRRSTQFPHCDQETTWDCGVACTQMVLRWLRPSRYPQIDGESTPLSFDEISERNWIIHACEGQSVWTVDIIIILQRLFDKELRQSFDFPLSARDNEDDVWDKARYLYLSKRFGVDETYKTYGYYRDAFERDELRVMQRFVLAKELNLPMCETQIDLETLVDVISRDQCIAMVLIDNAVLKRSGGDYAGHYVLLVGISTDNQDISQAESCCGKEQDSSSSTPYCLVVKNPNRPESISFITPSLFEKARTADGTDEDLILIAKAS